ncbi:MAG: cyclase [Acidimicrobiia bacterium]|nr:cyclase [Acidimicrobiia bacterium]
MGRRTWAILATLGLTVPISAVITAAPTAAAPVLIPLDCEATTPIGGQAADQDIAFDTTAPAQVLNSTLFTVSATAPAGTIPSDFGGYTVGYVKDFRIKIPVPANSTYSGSSLSGGTVSGTVGLVGSNVQVDIPGPIAGGASYQFPTVNVDLTSSGVDGALIQPKIGGTSFANPGFELTARF